MDQTLQRVVRQRARDRCESCRLSQEFAPIVRFHVEHIRTRQHGGDDDPANLCLACPHCNRFKGPNLTAVDRDTGQIVRLFNPRLDGWGDEVLSISS